MLSGRVSVAGDAMHIAPVPTASFAQIRGIGVDARGALHLLLFFINYCITPKTEFNVNYLFVLMFFYPFICLFGRQKLFHLFHYLTSSKSLTVHLVQMYNADTWRFHCTFLFTPIWPHPDLKIYPIYNCTNINI